MRIRVSLLAVLVLSIAAVAAQSPAPKDVDLKAPDGIKLKATYYAASKPGPAVMLFHQCNRERKVWKDLASRLADSGIHVLTLDFRGFGESGGPRMTNLAAPESQRTIVEVWPGDVDVAYNYLISLPGVNKDVIGAAGASCGVNQSIQLASRHPEVKSLALLSGGTTRQGREFLKTHKTLPMLFSAADDDGGIVEIMQWYMALSGYPGNDFIRYKKGGHGSDMFAPHPELPGKIVSWFQTTLVKTPGRAPDTEAARKLAQAPPVLAMLDAPDGPARAMKYLEEARSKDPKATPFPEGVVNIMAYEHLQSGDTKGAVELARLNVAAYPQSPNVYDSLSDAYLADGQRDLAKQFAQKALDVLAASKDDPPQGRDAIKQSAEQKLKQLSEQ